MPRVAGVLEIFGGRRRSSTTGRNIAIAPKEMAAIVLGAFTWRAEWQGLHGLFTLDNTSVVSAMSHVAKHT